MKMKLWKKILVIIAVIIVGLLLTKNFIIKSVVSLATKQVTGCAVKIGKFQVGVFKPRVHITEFRLFNPKGFPKETLFSMDEATVEYDLPSILKGKLHLPLVVLHLDSMTIIKNAEGVLNVDAIKIVQEGKTAEPEKKAEKPAEPKKESKPLAMQIDKVDLSLGKVIYKDFTKMNGDEPSIKIIDSGIQNKVFKNITSAQQLATLILVTGAKSAAIKSAGLYAATALLGVGFLPAGVAGVLISEDSAVQDFESDYSKVFETALEVLKTSGEIKLSDQDKKVIKANVDGADIAVAFEKTGGKTRVTLSARKYLLPKKQLAEQLLYKISEAIK